MAKVLDNIKQKTENLIKSIEGLGKTRQDIAEPLGIKVNSISSALSRGGNEELYNKINSYYKYLSVKETENYNVGEAVKKIEAMSSVILTALAEVIGNQKGQMSSTIKDELEKMVNKQLDASE